MESKKSSFSKVMLHLSVHEILDVVSAMYRFGRASFALVFHLFTQARILFSKIQQTNKFDNDPLCRDFALV